MIDDNILKLIADDAIYQQNEQLKRKLIKLADESDRAKWARLQEEHLTKENQYHD